MKASHQENGLGDVVGSMQETIYPNDRWTNGRPV